MFKIIKVPFFEDDRGSLGVIEELPFQTERLYYIMNPSKKRGGHRHKRTSQALICIQGSVSIYMNDGQNQETVKLSSPHDCLIIEPKDWHEMFNFSNDCMIIVLASSKYDPNDYINEEYK